MEVPTWKPLNPTETVIKSDASWGGDGTTTGYLDPKKIQAGKQVMPILHRGWAMAADDLSRLGAGTDPMAAIRSYTADAINKQKEKLCLANCLVCTSAILPAESSDHRCGQSRRRRWRCSQLPDCG